MHSERIAPAMANGWHQPWQRHWQNDGDAMAKRWRVFTGTGTGTGLIPWLLFVVAQCKFDFMHQTQTRELDAMGDQS